MHQYSIEKTELDKVLDKFEFAMNCWNYKIPENLDVIDNAPWQQKPCSIIKER